MSERMGLSEPEGHEAYWRLAFLLPDRIAEDLRMTREVDRVSATEIVRRAVSWYHAGREAVDVQHGLIIGEGPDRLRYMDIHEVDGPPHAHEGGYTKVSINVTNEIAACIQDDLQQLAPQEVSLDEYMTRCLKWYGRIREKFELGWNVALHYPPGNRVGYYRKFLDNVEIGPDTKVQRFLSNFRLRW